MCMSTYLNIKFIFRALLIKIRKLKRINLLAQRLKRTHRQLTSRGFKKAHVSDYISTSDAAQNAGTDSSSRYTDLYKVSTC